MAGENDGKGSDANDEVTVEVTDDGAGPGAAAGGSVAQPNSAATTGAAAHVPLTEEAVAQLQRDLDTERRLRADAEGRATRAETGQRNAGDEVRLHQLGMVNGALEVLGSKQSTLEVEYAEAMGAGDFAKAAKIQTAMSRNAAETLQLEQGKMSLEAQPARTAVPAAPAVMTPAERLARIAGGLTPKSAAWVRAHPEYAYDPDLTDAMIGAHHVALGKHKLVNESPEYFAFIEKTLGVGSSDQRILTPTPTPTPSPLSAAAAPAAERDVQPSAAPASRGNGSKRVVKLSKEQVEAARISGLSNEEYARQLVRTDLQGKTTH